MSGFVEYQPREPMAERAPPPQGLRIREATRGDLAALTNMTQQRSGDHPAQIYERLSQELGETGRVGLNVVFIAAGERSTVGYARARFFDRPRDAPDATAPRGWYLMGLYVAPEFRRCGIARELTRARLDWLAGRTVEVRAFVNAENRAALDLLASFRFEEETRDFTFPNVTFEGGEGVLLRARLAAPPAA